MAAIYSFDNLKNFIRLQDFYSSSGYESSSLLKSSSVLIETPSHPSNNLSSASFCSQVIVFPSVSFSIIFSASEPNSAARISRIVKMSSIELIVFRRRRIILPNPGNTNRRKLGNFDCPIFSMTQVSLVLPPTLQNYDENFTENE